MQAIPIDSHKVVPINEDPTYLITDAHLERDLSLQVITAANERPGCSYLSMACRCLLSGSVAALRGISAICCAKNPPALSLAQDQLLSVGSAKTPTENNKKTADVDLITRTVMRFPNKKTLKALHELRAILKERTEDLSDDYINWLLGGSSQDARGGFRDARSLRKFLTAEPATLSSSRLMTGLSTLVHALAYRAIKCKQSEPPIEYQGQRNIDEEEMHGWLCRFKDNAGTDHSRRYPDSRTCIIKGVSESLILDHFKGDIREELSDVSDDEDAVYVRKNKTAMQFKSKRTDGKYTWVGAAHAGDIPVSSSLSASTLLALAALEALGISEPQKIELLAGTLILPTYHRADYHSVPETAAAVDHFINERSNPDNPTAVLTPKQAFAKGLKLMTSCVASEFQKSVRILSEDILAKTTDVGYTPEKK